MGKDNYRFWKCFTPEDKEKSKFIKNAKQMASRGFLNNVPRSRIMSTHPFNLMEKFNAPEGSHYRVKYTSGMTFWKNSVDGEIMYILEYYGLIYIFKRKLKGGKNDKS